MTLTRDSDDASYYQRVDANLAAAGLDRLRARPRTALQAAECLIMVYVARGSDVGWLSSTYSGRFGNDWCAQIGGQAWTASGESRRVDRWHIIVERVAGQDLAEPAIFPLRAVYDDLYRRMHEGRQLPLFAEVS